MSLFSPLFTALNRANVRYVIVGGLATVLHGYTRLTDDVDLMIDLAPEAALRTIEALRDLGLKPRAPVQLLDFALAERRKQWNEEKGMRVFSLFDPAQPMRELDLLVENPLEFDVLWRDSEVKDLGECTVHIASIPHLIGMKRAAGRPLDLLDIEALEEIVKRRGDTLAEPSWGGWETHRKDQLIRGLAATSAQRIAWLESMIELAWSSGALPRKRPDSSEP